MDLLKVTNRNKIYKFYKKVKLEENSIFQNTGTLGVTTTVV